ncbi:MAG: cytochrome c family protein, partial [Gemmataceae bacterium]|nr:cytochrome c family protein [Gemmataceae bacterium]
MSTDVGAAACLTVGLAVAGWAVADPPPARLPDAPPLAARPYGVGDPPFAHPSAASCAAASCHGGANPTRPGSEHTVWAAIASPDGPHDPHATAYRVLFNDTSVRIRRLLNRVPAYRDALCLKCHAEPGVEPAAATTAGVGCGSCHGPAEKWLTAHYQPGWTGLSNRQKWENYGFVPTKNLVARATNCAACHVGAADREVNHDLIAAGHPRLNFEHTRFHFSPGYRKHWRERIPQPDFEVRAWAVGQVASLRAAADLLRARAERAEDGVAPWPEFAGLACYSCHQSVGTGEPRRAARPRDRGVGRAGWEVWYTAAAGVAFTHSPDLFTSVPAPKLDGLGPLGRLAAKPYPDPATVAVQARTVVAELDRWLAAAQAAEDRGLGRLPPDLPRRIAHDLAAGVPSDNPSGLTDSDWDFLAPRYLGCAAMAHAAGGRAAAPGWADPVAG